uniref:Uncharacterized protein n=1 Tax=Arundo donax TaxID=35708 RepID=A0A0A9GCD1_ARUDO
MCRLFSLLFPRPYRAAANRRLTISFTSYHHQIVSRPQAHGQIRSFEPSPSDPSQTEMVQLCKFTKQFNQDYTSKNDIY